MNPRTCLETVPGTPPALSPGDRQSLARLYQRVFAGPPWNEHTVCPASGTFFGTDTRPGAPCPEACGARLKAAYPLGETERSISAELAQPEARLWLLRDRQRRDRIVGFTWGFAYANHEAFAAAKYKTRDMQRAISSLLHRQRLGINGLWYLSESGIEDDPRYRGQGLSREFHARRLATARSLGLTAIQRTSAFGPMYRTSRRTMTQIMGTETEADRVSGLLKPTGRIVGGLADREIEGRVLFARQPSLTV